MQTELSIMKDWMINFLRSKDAMKKEIVEITNKDNSLYVEFKTKKRKFLLLVEPKDNILLKNNESIVVFNTKENFDWMIKIWNKFASYNDISI